MISRGNRGYGMDLRLRVIAAYEEGGSISDLARLFRITRATIYSWIARKAVKGSPEPLKDFTNGPPPKVDPERIFILLKDNPSLTQKTIAQMLGLSTRVVCKFVHRLGFTRKKNNIYILKGITPLNRPLLKKFKLKIPHKSFIWMKQE